ncbi:hypothetical protein [Dyella japonica]|uniref:hypothetical protein n=1 Tax=Dyella japonica TaxID=231455 RepID=UPI00138F38A4|nr:hypothetical protein [Dyella japonica]
MKTAFRRSTGSLMGTRCSHAMTRCHAVDLECADMNGNPPGRQLTEANRDVHQAAMVLGEFL